MRVWSGGRRSAREVDAQPLQWALDVADRVDGDAGLERGRLELRVSEQDLDHANSTPCSSRCVAKLCLRVCGEMRLAMPARSLAAVTARLS